MQKLPDQKKIRWMCRRGLLELDLVLTKILDKQYDQLTTQQQHMFVELLSAPDNELLAWLLGQTKLPMHWSAGKIALVRLLQQVSAH